jgi:hypothetical protein
MYEICKIYWFLGIGSMRSKAKTYRKADKSEFSPRCGGPDNAGSRHAEARRRR